MFPEIKLPESADKALANLADKPTMAIGTTIADLWYLACGGITAAADKKRLRIAHSLDLFKKELEEKTKKIPAEKLVEPNTQIVLTALQDAQYCVEDETLRSMFANLIASSINADTSELVHPSFSGIIRQMTSLDAQNAILFKKRRSMPIVRLNFSGTENKGTLQTADNVFLGNPIIKDIGRQSISMTCLSIFGILSLNYTMQLTDDKQYEPFYDLDEYKQMESQTIKHNPTSQYQSVEVGKGIAQITPLGKQFLSICT